MPSARNAVPAGTPRADVDGAAQPRPVLRDLDRVAVCEPEALGVLGRELELLAGRR